MSFVLVIIVIEMIMEINKTSCKRNVPVSWGDILSVELLVEIYNMSVK